MRKASHLSADLQGCKVSIISVSFGYVDQQCIPRKELDTTSSYTIAYL